LIAKVCEILPDSKFPFLRSNWAWLTAAQDGRVNRFVVACHTLPVPQPSQTQYCYDDGQDRQAIQKSKCKRTIRVHTIDRSQIAGRHIAELRIATGRPG
jgi:hypothetical protein